MLLLCESSAMRCTHSMPSERMVFIVAVSTPWTTRDDVSRTLRDDDKHTRDGGLTNSITMANKHMAITTCRWVQCCG